MELPRQLANKVIRQIVDHIFSDDMIVEPCDYTIIRVVFRQLGGSWEALVDGDPGVINKLIQAISVWGARPERKKKSLQNI